MRDRKRVNADGRKRWEGTESLVGRRNCNQDILPKGGGYFQQMEKSYLKASLMLAESNHENPTFQDAVKLSSLNKGLCDGHHRSC